MSSSVPSLSIHRLIPRGEQKWLTCADANKQEMIICGTDQGIIYQTHLSTLDQPLTSKCLLGLFESQLLKIALPLVFYDQCLGHTRSITDLCYFDSDENYFLSCSADKDIRLWNSMQSHSITIYRSHLSPIWCLAAHSKTDRFASGSMDQTVRLWTPERINVLRTFIYPSADINSVGFHPNGKYLAAGSADGWIILWSLEQAEPARIFKSNSSVEHIKFTSDGNHLISINSNEQSKTDSISRWDIRSAKEQPLIIDIPNQYCLMKPCQIEDTQQFVTGFHQSLLFFYTTDRQDEEKYRQANLSDQSAVKRLIHLVSNQSNKLLVITQ